MKKNGRKVNRKMIAVAMAYSGLDGDQVGRMCDPPVTRQAICNLLTGKSGNPRLIDQLVDILTPPLESLFREASHNHIDIPDILFPQASDPPKQEAL
ncbi:MAG: hypothetical protein JW715_12715 [Sedimentisphaerales bacterium]|nr:hypothetical protein [Sedimentisphaerales bacterium]